MAGQIIERGKNKWLVRVYLGRDENNKRKYHNKTIHGNKKAAQTYLNKALREKDTGTFFEASKESVKKYLDRWVETAVKARVSNKTFRSYQELIRLYIVTTIGDARLVDITPMQIQELYNKMLGNGLSPRTVRYTHAVLRNSLEQAVKWQMLHRNPAQFVDLPKQKRREMQAFSTEDAKTFLKASAGSKWDTLFLLLLTTGMRPGEALGLKWSDIDFQDGKLRILRTLIRNSNKWSFEEPKTNRSRRTIPIPSSVMRILKEHRKDQIESKLANGDYQDYNLVFASQNGDPLHEQNIVRRHFKPILERAGLSLNYRLYDLRHSCATLLLSQGENPKIVSERLGHASVTLTLDTYSHVLPDMQQGAADKLESLLF